MSVPVELSALRTHLAEFGDRAFLVSVNEDETPHVVTVVVRIDGDHLVMGAGKRTRANGTDRPTVTLLWAPVGDGEYSLIVDGTYAGATTGGDVAVTPTAAILHRIAGAAGDGPNCVPLTDS